MIGYYNFSTVGNGHIKNNLPCQDANLVETLPNGWVIGVIADGLGSSKHSEIGSSLAVETVVRYIRNNLPPAWDVKILESLLTVAYNNAVVAISELAKRDGNPIQDYDTTMTAVIYDGMNVVYGHVGDGGIITLDKFGYYSTLTNRQKGGAWNEVVPLRQGSAYWEFGYSNDPICAILMATDGILDEGILPALLINEPEPIHIKYVRQFMDRNVLNVNTKSDFTVVQKSIIDYFNSSEKSHISDDKTLVGIINTDVLPKVRDESYYASPDWQYLKEKQNSLLYGKTVIQEPKLPIQGIRQPEPTSEPTQGRIDNKHTSSDLLKEYGNYAVILLLVVVIVLITVFVILPAVHPLGIENNTTPSINDNESQLGNPDFPLITPTMYADTEPPSINDESPLPAPDMENESQLNGSEYSIYEKPELSHEFNTEMIGDNTSHFQAENSTMDI